MISCLSKLKKNRGEIFQGTVLWFDETKGFGYINCDSGEKVFVHFSAINNNGLRTLSEGQRVQFGIVQDKKGNSAVNVDLI